MKIIKSILFNIFFTSVLFASNNADIFTIHDGNPEIVQSKYMKYLEVPDHDISYNELKNSDWRNNLQSQQSMYNGFWVKIIIENLSSTKEMGIHHNFNFEKKLIYKNSNEIKIYDFLDSENENYKYKERNRIWYDYKIIMPIGEITEVYSFFRSQPLDRMNARQGGIDRITIGTWEQIEFNENFRTLRYIINISVFSFFGIYFFMFYSVSRDNNYLWIGILLTIFSLQGLAFSSSSYLGFRFNYMYGPIGFTIVSAITIQFLRNILLLNKENKKIDKIYVWTIKFYLILMLIYFYDSFYYPDGEMYKNLVLYPYPRFGVGTFPVYFSFVPVIFIVILSIFFSAKMWLNNDKAAGYLFITFMIPFFSGVIFIIAYFTSKSFHEDFFVKIIIQSIPAFSLLFLPSTIGLALAERVNQFKKRTINLLEEKVKTRTHELTNANLSITQSINTASIIQNAILPEIDCNKYGFREFEYLWEPRDIVGGDFYWLDKNDHWTSFVVADCTGHGIPGAFMTLISSTLLDRVRSLDDLSRPDVILNQLDELLESKLKLKENKTMEFGMDIGICSFSQEDKLLRFSGAKMNLYKIVDDKVNEFKGNKISIGYSEKPHPIKFTNHEIDLSENPNFYIFSDGVTDQVGGSKNLMYGKKRLLKHINHSTKIKTVIQNIKDDLNDYQKDNSRRDDLSLFGFSIA